MHIVLNRNWIAAGTAAVLLTMAVPASTASAQSLGRVETTQSNAPDYFYHVQPGSRTIQVHVLGTVNSPGLYEVNDGTDLGQLLALAGGPVMTPRARRNRRQVNVRLFRPSGVETRALFTAEIDDGSLYTQQYPSLQEGDILRIDVVERQRFNWRDGVSIVSAAASIVFVLDRVRDPR